MIFIKFDINKKYEAEGYDSFEELVKLENYNDIEHIRCIHSKVKFMVLPTKLKI